MFRTFSLAVEFLVFSSLHLKRLIKSTNPLQSFRIEVYSGKSNDLVAQGYALPSTLHDTYGKASVPLLTKKGLPVGKIYCKISPKTIPTQLF